MTADPSGRSRTAGAAEVVAERLAEAVDGFTPLTRESDVVTDGPPHFFIRDAAGQVLRVVVTAWTCRVCGGPLSEARTALGLTLCGGACHRAAATHLYPTEQALKGRETEDAD